MIASTLRSNLMKLATVYAQATGTTLPQISKKFYGNVSFFTAFRSGDKSISIDKYDEVVGLLRKAWPPEAEWPYLRVVFFPSPVTKKKSVPRRGNGVVRESRIA